MRVTGKSRFGINHRAETRTRDAGITKFDLAYFLTTAAMNLACISGRDAADQAQRGTGLRCLGLGLLCQHVAGIGQVDIAGHNDGFYPFPLSRFFKPGWAL